MARVLILGGTAEAAELAARLAGDDRLETVTSLAGLTRMPTAMAGRVRRGGFGGPGGLAAFLKEERYDALIDATHPFAARIAAHAAEAAEIAGVARVKLLRPGFESFVGPQPVPTRHGLTMGELSREILVSNGNVTAVVRQLQRQLLVDVRASQADRRISIVTLTADGRRHFAELATAYQQWVGELLDAIADDDQRELFDLLAEVKSSIETVEAEEAPAAVSPAKV